MSEVTVKQLADTVGTPVDRLLKQMLWATFALAGVFLVIKYFEYSHKIHAGLLPGKFFATDAIQADRPHLFFSLYFMMTGIHGLHIVIGMGLMVWIYRRAQRGVFSHRYYYPVENLGLYWHLVDIIWIFLFPLLYLVR